MDPNCKPFMRVLTLFLDQENNNCNRAKEMIRLVDIGFFEEDYSAEWASPTFSIPKKNG
jgi:hypothetical protein